MDEIVLHDSSKFIPQSYIYHQIMLIRKTLQSQFHSYYSNHTQPSLENRTVILVDDVLRETEELTACIQSIRKQNPKNIIVAAPVATSRAAHLLAEEEFRFFYLFMEFTAHNKPYTYFPQVAEEEERGRVSAAELN